MESQTFLRLIISHEHLESRISLKPFMKLHLGSQQYVHNKCHFHGIEKETKKNIFRHWELPLVPLIIVVAIIPFVTPSMDMIVIHWEWLEDIFTIKNIERIVIGILRQFFFFLFKEEIFSINYLQNDTCVVLDGNTLVAEQLTCIW